MLFSPSIMKKYPALDLKTEKALAQQYRDTKDKSIKDKLILHNLRFVVYTANKFYQNNPGYVKDDLIQEGVIGLMRAVDKYDPERNIRLCSYGRFWIQVYMQNYIHTSNSAFNQRKSRARNADQEAATVEFTNDWHMSQLDRANIDPGALADEQMITANRLASLRQLMSGTNKKFSNNESTIIKYRILSENPETLQLIGNRLGLSRERVRQVEKRLMENLRQSIDDAHGVW